MIVVVSIALFGLLGGMSFITKKQLNAEIMTTANFLAQEKMEEKIAKKRDSGAGYNGSDLNIGTTTENPVSGFANYTRSVEICYVDATFGSPDCDPGAPNMDLGYKRITVEVNYTGSLPDLPSPTVGLVVLTTAVANY